MAHRQAARRSQSRPRSSTLASVGGASFPSGHATQAAAFWLALALALHTWWAAVAAVAVVLVVGASRVVLGVHYPGDVVAGALLGGDLGRVRAPDRGAVSVRKRIGEHDRRLMRHAYGRARRRAIAG